MKKQAINESVNKMKYLFEYHFKSNGSERDVQETPVKFNEIGEKYSDIDNEYPTFSQYKNEVVIDEDEPVKPEGNQPPQEQPAADPNPSPAAPAPVTPEAPQSPAPEQPISPATPEPVQPPAPPVTTIPQTTVADPSMNNDLEMKLNDQIQKTDQIYGVIQQIQQSLAGGTNNMDINMKLDQVAKEVQDMKNPSYDQQFDMISKNSYPYNIKLSDYWGWEDNKEEEKPQEYTLNQSDIDNYDPNAIKQSLGLN